MARRIRSPIFWGWLATALLLGVGLLFDWHYGFVLAMCTVGLLALEAVECESGLVNLPVQVRAAFLVLLLAVEATPLPQLYWLPTIGVWVLVLFDYCIMARLLTMLPWNRSQPLSLEFVRSVWLSPDLRKVRGTMTSTCPG